MSGRRDPAYGGSGGGRVGCAADRRASHKRVGWEVEVLTTRRSTPIAGCPCCRRARRTRTASTSRASPSTLVVRATSTLVAAKYSGNHGSSTRSTSGHGSMRRVRAAPSSTRPFVPPTPMCSSPRRTCSLPSPRRPLGPPPVLFHPAAHDEPPLRCPCTPRFAAASGFAFYTEAARLVERVRYSGRTRHRGGLGIDTGTATRLGARHARPRTCPTSSFSVASMRAGAILAVELFAATTPPAGPISLVFAARWCPSAPHPDVVVAVASTNTKLGSCGGGGGGGSLVAVGYDRSRSRARILERGFPRRARAFAAPVTRRSSGAGWRSTLPRSR